MQSTTATAGSVPMAQQPAGGAQYVVPPGQQGVIVDAQKFDMLRQQLPAVSIFLQPLAAPSALGFASFFCATWTVSTWYADWYGSNLSPSIIAPFALLMGITEFIAGMFCYPARDTTGTVFHGAWGGWWMAWGAYYIMTSQGFISGFTKFDKNDELAMWQVTIAAITGMICLVTVARDILISGANLLLFVGSVLFFSGWFTGTTNCLKAGAYFWAAASIVLLIRAVVYMLPYNRQEEYGDLITAKAVRGQPRVAVPIGEPGIRTFH